MRKLSLQDGAETFDVTVIEANAPSRIVLFAVGGGGDPERHLPLLTCFAACGCAVVAPHFERFTSPRATESQFLLRARRLTLALESVGLPDLVTVGVGHSIGAAMLLALAGGLAWMGPGQCLSITPVERIKRLALLAPATAFFQAPQALDRVTTPILAFAGMKDTITPPAQAEFLKHALGSHSPIDVRIIEDAGHFSFMNKPPPATEESLPNREAFLVGLTAELCRFVTC